MHQSIEELVGKIREINLRGPIAAEGRGSGRYGLALERELGIEKNSSKAPDFKGIEIKTKASAKLQTLFSRTPSRYTGCANALDVLHTHGYDKKGRRQLYTSMTSKGDSLGFSIQLAEHYISVVRNNEEIMQYDNERLEQALISKHTESAFVTVQTHDQGATCTFDSLVHCKQPSFARLRELIDTGHIYLDFTLSVKNGKARDHGFLWRINGTEIEAIFAETHKYNLL